MDRAHRATEERPPRRSSDSTDLIETVRRLSERPAEDHWRVLRGSRDGPFQVAFVRTPLKRLVEPLYDLHGCLHAVVPAGPNDLAPFQSLEDRLRSDLGHWLITAAMVTTQAERSVHVYTDPEGPGPDALEEWVGRLAADVFRLEWNIDRTWEAVRRFM